MGKKWELVFDDAIGCKGNHINSALVSAQTRKRIYWTNIQGGIIPQPKDEGLTISDIAEKEMIKGYKYRLDPTPEQIVQMEKTFGCCRYVYNWA